MLLHCVLSMIKLKSQWHCRCKVGPPHYSYPKGKTSEDRGEEKLFFEGPQRAKHLHGESWALPPLRYTLQML